MITRRLIVFDVVAAAATSASFGPPRPGMILSTRAASRARFARSRVSSETYEPCRNLFEADNEGLKHNSLSLGKPDPCSYSNVM